MSSKQIFIDKQTNELFKSRYQHECKRVNRLMVWLMTAQWLAGIAFAVFCSPLTWIGQHYPANVQIWAAILLGGAISGFAILWTRTFPESAHTRHVVAVAQMMWSALLIHLSGGRIETHFHVFASLAILSIYRDWKILITATIVVAIDHLVRGVFYPFSAFGIITESPYRWVEHAAWVIFEVSFLVPGCMRQRNEIHELCARQTEIEQAKKSVERMVTERTSELATVNQRLAQKTAEAEMRALVARHTDNAVVIMDQTSRIEWVNEGFTRITGYSLEEVKNKQAYFQHELQTDPATLGRMRTAIDSRTGFGAESVNNRNGGEPKCLSRMIQALQADEKQQILFHTDQLRKDGSQYVAEIRLQQSRYQDRDVFLALILDVTERVEAENRHSQLQRQLVDASRRASVADVATDVLHNVGNIMNSVNVSAGVIRRKYQHSALFCLEKASDLISDHESDFGQFVTTDDRGKKLPNYVIKVTEALKLEHEQIDVELGDMIKNVELIKDIVSVQQSMAKPAGARQILSAEEVVTDSVTANKGTLRTHRIAITTELEENLPQLVVDKHKILQILINLIQNAKDAVVENQTPNPEIRISVCREGQNILFEVKDNGVGIANGNLDQIFQHGFTTKESGHGFGLDSSAYSAVELGGVLTAASSGIGEGATFQLRLPVDKSEFDQIAIFSFTGQTSLDRSGCTEPTAACSMQDGDLA